MVSRKLIGVWAALDFFLLAAGVVAVALSIVWRAENVLLNLVLTPNYLAVGLALGIALLVTFLLSVGAIIQKNHVTIGLVILNYMLLVDATGIVIVGTYIWFFSLQERNNFFARWAAASSDIRIKLQDQLHCCGYFNGSNLAETGSGFCTSQDFVMNLNSSVASNFCVQPITNFADMTLNNIFTSRFASTIYGYMAVILCLLLASICVIKKRQEDERFRRIDEKRGGRGFV